MTRNPTIVFMLAILEASFSLSAASQTSAELKDYFRDSIGLSQEQIADIQNGKAVAKVLKSRTPAEIFVFGAVYIKATPESYVHLAGDFDRLRKLPEFLAIGKFSDPPRATDLEDFNLDSDDIKSLKECKPGDCEVQMPAEGIENIHKSINWSAPPAELDRQVNQHLHQRVIEGLQAYRRDGRSDLLFDFSKHTGQKLILYTDAPAPFPEGDETNDYFPGFDVKNNPVNGTTPPGFGPNTRVILRFNVVPAMGTDQPLTISRGTDLTAGNDPLLVPLGVTTPPPGVPVRLLTLNETFDNFGRLLQLLGTNMVQADGGFGQPYDNPATETPSANSTEVWQIANLTGDTHPIHFHLVNAQIISRQQFSARTYNGTPHLKGDPVAPGPTERGWKDTVRMNPGEVTTLIMRFKLPMVPFAVPESPRTGGHEYVWHCHILEHEEHDMMRPLIVT